MATLQATNGLVAERLTDIVRASGVPRIEGVPAAIMPDPEKLP